MSDTMDLVRRTRRNRARSACNANAVLSQLSYRPWTDTGLYGWFEFELPVLGVGQEPGACPGDSYAALL